jgi:DNA polymerase III epsilon subunit-like protein
VRYRTHDLTGGYDYDPDAAIAWAREALADPRTVLLDSETTGLEGYMLELAVIGTDGEPLLNTLIKPPVPCEPGAQRVHRITPDQYASAPTFAQAWSSIALVLGDRRIVVYNAEFDRGIMARDLEHAWPGNAEKLLGLLGSEWDCLMLRRDQWTGERLRLNGQHRALGDCRAALALLREMADPDQ